MLERTRSLACSLSPFFHPSPPPVFLFVSVRPSSCRGLLTFPSLRSVKGSGEFIADTTPACRKARPLFDVSVIFVSDISRDYARCGLDRAIVSELFCSLCFSSFQISHESHAIEFHVIESSWFPAENKSCTVTAPSISGRAKIFTFHFFIGKKVESYVIIRPL